MTVREEAGCHDRRKADIAQKGKEVGMRGLSQGPRNQSIMFMFLDDQGHFWHPQFRQSAFG